MWLENLVVRLRLVTELFFFSRLCESALSQGNVIMISQPERGAVWISGHNSYPITWTQSKYCFKWNIDLLDSDENKVVEISFGLSEFKDDVMKHSWLVPQTIQSGSYRIKICENSAPETCGNSGSFTIRKSNEPASVDEDDSEAFSPVQATQVSGGFALNNVTSQKTGDLHELPHVLRRQKRVEREQTYFKRMTEQISEQQHGECTIERVHRPSKETFVERYMKPRKPAILTGMMDSWEATKSWDFDQLGDILTKGVKVDIMEGTTPYSQWNKFRSRFSDIYREPAKVIMKDFHLMYPELMDSIRFPEFSQDYLEFVDEDTRPSQLSFEMTPRRSGFHWRVEVLNASLWSALIFGRRRWGLYPPSQYFVPGAAHNNHRTQTSHQSEPFTWWIYTRPELQDDYKPLECVQQPGELLYIPSGWWWSNVNIDDSIAMQKTACDETNIRTCMDELKEIADSAGDNFHADVFIQLRHYLAKQDPGVLTHDDQLFKSPIRNLGQTNTEYSYRFHEDVWKRYFEDVMEDEDSQ